jgi:uncharacterized protein (TIGR02145 family)
MSSSDGIIYRINNFRFDGLSIRCIKDSSSGVTSFFVPNVTTQLVSSITNNSASTGGNVISDGGSIVTARGVAYGNTASPTIAGTITNDGAGTGSFSSQLIGLTGSTYYYIRAYATNAVGTAYGNEVNFSTGVSIPGIRCPGSPTVTDIDGNLYHTVQIGTQCWTQSNLKVSKYRNGDAINTGLVDFDWRFTTTGAYAIYNNDSVNDGLYGKLYNHYAVMDTRGLCPTGWHVPTDGEWNVLVTFLDPNSNINCAECHQSWIAGGMLKSNSTQPIPEGWRIPNFGATNSFGFTALPGGLRNGVGPFTTAVSNGNWWTSSLDGSLAWQRALFYDNGPIKRLHYHRTAGFSVRCLRD